MFWHDAVAIQPVLYGADVRQKALLADNHSNITYAYPYEELQVFADNFWSNQLCTTIVDLRDAFPQLTLRRTYQGYYAVIPADSGEILFVFLDWNLMAWETMLARSAFPSREEARPIIEKIPGEYRDALNIPFYDLPTGTIYLACYYTDGIELITYTNSDAEPDWEVASYFFAPISVYYLRSDWESNGLRFILFNRYPPLPIILEIDRQNNIVDPTPGIATTSPWVTTGTAVIMSLLFAFLNFLCLRSMYKDMKARHGESDAKKRLRKWSMVYFADIPLFLATFWFSLTVGYTVTLLTAFAHLIAVMIAESICRRRTLQQATDAIEMSA